MYNAINIWLWIIGISFTVISALVIGLGYWADKRKKRKQDDFWKQVALEDLERRRPDESQS